MDGSPLSEAGHYKCRAPHRARPPLVIMCVMATNAPSGSAASAASVKRNPGYRRIATEEAFATPEMFRLYREALARKSIDDPGFNSMWGFYLGSPSERATG